MNDVLKFSIRHYAIKHFADYLSNYQNNFL